MKLKTPNTIEVLLHHHSSPTVHPRSYAPAVSAATAMLLQNGCIEPDCEHEGQYNTTPKGRRLVQTLCAVEIPEDLQKITASLTVLGAPPPEVGSTMTFDGREYQIDKVTPTRITHDEYGNQVDLPAFQIEASHNSHS